MDDETAPSCGKRVPRVVWCGYRDWSQRLRNAMDESADAVIVETFATPEPFVEFMQSQPDIDVVVLAGWSWIVPKEVVARYRCIGLHPSDLPKYRGGSPLQHQILDGLTDTQCSLFLLTPALDVGPVIAKTPMSLQGSIQDIFDEFVRAGAILLTKAFKTWPEWQAVEQDARQGFTRRRRKPEESRLTREQLQTFSLGELYNFIRALGDPYPNAYLEDERGNRLLFKQVAYEAAEGKHMESEEK